MPDPYLHGNRLTCPDCAGSGSGEIIMRAGEFTMLDGRTCPENDVRGPCKTCKGSGCVGKPAARIVAEMVAEARSRA